MSLRLSIGDFSRMTHLSVKALRNYHEIGLLAPATVDRHSGYRFYDVSQVAVAQVVRRLRDLDMPLEQIRSVLDAPDVAARNSAIVAHLARMEQQLQRTRETVAGLRSLLQAPEQDPRPVAFRAIAATPALALVDTVTVADFGAWWESAFGELYRAVADGGFRPSGPAGALYSGDLFEEEEGEVTAFVPVSDLPVPSGHGRLTVVRIPETEAAVMVHEGSMEEIDRTYAALGTVVAERAIGVDGPIREYYVVGPFDGADPAAYRTEVCWPIFRARP